MFGWMRKCWPLLLLLLVLPLVLGGCPEDKTPIYGNARIDFVWPSAGGALKLMWIGEPSAVTSA